MVKDKNVEVTIEAFFPCSRKDVPPSCPSRSVPGSSRITFRNEPPKYGRQMPQVCTDLNRVEWHYFCIINTGDSAVGRAVVNFEIGGGTGKTVGRGAENRPVSETAGRF